MTVPSPVLTQLRGVDGHRFRPPDEWQTADHRDERKHHRANGIDMHGRVQGQASEHACGGVTQAIGRPRMRRFVHGQGTQQDHKPRQKRNKIDGGQQADSVSQAPRPVDGVQVGIVKVLKGQGRSPRRLVTDKLRSYSAAHRTVMPSVVHSTRQYANNRAEVSHQPTRQRERQMRRFKSAAQAQRFLSVHGLVLNLFRVGRHLLRSAHHRVLRMRAFAEWDAVTYAC